MLIMPLPGTTRWIRQRKSRTCSLDVGPLNERTSHPSGLTCAMTWRIVPSLPLVSIPCSTMSRLWCCAAANNCCNSPSSSLSFSISADANARSVYLSTKSGSYSFNLTLLPSSTFHASCILFLLSNCRTCHLLLYHFNMEGYLSGPLRLSHFILGSVPVWVLRDNRGNARGRAALVKGASVVFYSMIGVGHAIELAQIVQPRLGHKRLNVALFTGRIARNEPAEGAVSFAHAAHLVHSAQKGFCLLRVDAVLDLD